MAEEKTRRLKQVAITLNIGTATIVEYLSAKGFEVENKPTTKITAEQFNMLAEEYAYCMQEAQEVNIGKTPQNNPIKVSVLTKDRANPFTVCSSALLRQMASINDIALYSLKAKSYRLDDVAFALDTTPSIIVGVLEKQGHRVAKN